VKTPRALYHHGEPLRVEIQSTVPNVQRLFVELLANDRIIRTETVKVVDHHAAIEFAPGSDLSGKVTIVAYDPGGDGEMAENSDLFATRTCSPSRRALDLKARLTEAQSSRASPREHSALQSSDGRAQRPAGRSIRLGG
jgi:hypothetical protein